MQETKLLQTIDKLKTTATEANREARVAKTLQKLAAPKRWQLANGKQVAVQTPLTARARELAQLYHGLRLPLVSLEERLDVLLHVKWTVKEFDCALTRELVDLVRPSFVVHVHSLLILESDNRSGRIEREADALHQSTQIGPEAD